MVSNKISDNLNPKTIHNNPHEVKKSIGSIITILRATVFLIHLISITMWRKYYLFFLNLTKDFSNNTTKLTKEFENTIQEV